MRTLSLLLLLAALPAFALPASVDWPRYEEGFGDAQLHVFDHPYYLGLQQDDRVDYCDGWADGWRETHQERSPAFIASICVD